MRGASVRARPCEGRAFRAEGVVSSAGARGRASPETGLCCSAVVFCSRPACEQQMSPVWGGVGVAEGEVGFDTKARV